jgi:hypothetical protein
MHFLNSKVLFALAFATYTAALAFPNFNTQCIREVDTGCVDDDGCCGDFQCLRVEYFRPYNYVSILLYSLLYF